MADRESLIVGLEFAYGDSAERAGGWVNLDRLVAEIWDPSTDPQDARRYYLNQITHAADSWLSAPELRAISVKEAAWLEVHGEHRPVSKHDAIVLGFDGSRGRAKSKPDATALVAMRVSDGFSWQVGVWEPPDGPTEQDWVLSELEVEAAVDEMFNDFTVVGFYGDPAMWEDRVAKWEAKYFRRLKVKCTAEKPIAFNTRAISKVVYGFEALHGAIVNGEISYDGSRGLTRHALNARRQKVRSGIVLRKPNDDYLAKIDATYAWMLANLCRLDALGKGVGAHVGTVPRRIY
jgi:hypothetical protein